MPYCNAPCYNWSVGWMKYILISLFIVGCGKDMSSANCPVPANQVNSDGSYNYYIKGQSPNLVPDILAIAFVDNSYSTVCSATSIEKAISELTAAKNALKAENVGVDYTNWATVFLDQLITDAESRLK